MHSSNKILSNSYAIEPHIHRYPISLQRMVMDLLLPANGDDYSLQNISLSTLDSGNLSDEQIQQLLKDAELRLKAVSKSSLILSNTSKQSSLSSVQNRYHSGSIYFTHISCHWSLTYCFAVYVRDEMVAFRPHISNQLSKELRSTRPCSLRPTNENLRMVFVMWKTQYQ